MAYYYNNFSIDKKYSLSGSIYFENENISEQNTSTMNGIFKINGSLNLNRDGLYYANLEIKNLFINNSNGCGSMGSVTTSADAENLITFTYKYREVSFKSLSDLHTIQITPDNEHSAMFPLLLL